MRLIRLSLGTAVAVCIAVAPPETRALDTPHHMTLPDGSVDENDCPVCHKPDMSLERSPLETCTLCHAETTHGGSLEHLRASAADVAAAMIGRPKDAAALPLTKEGTMVCFTCHRYHDPAVLDESWLASGWLPSDTGLAGAVRAGVTARWERLEKAYDKGPESALFAKAGTRLLRLPAADGTLCKQCHGSLW